MKKTLRTVIVVTVLSLLILSGCGVVEMAQLPHKNPEKWPTFDPNDYGVEIKRKENGSFSYHWSLDAKFDEDNNVIPYWKPWGKSFGSHTVKGYLNGNTYPVIFDTGSNPMIILSEKIVTENDLAVFFFDPENKETSDGFVLVDSLKIGSYELTNYPCGLWNYRPQLRFLGLPLPEDEMIIIPLDMMRQFNYFKFDDLQRELSFSKTTSFAPADKAEWLALPFRFEGLYLMLDVSIEGIPTTLMLDTGAYYQLELNESIVQEIFKKRQDFEKAWKKTKHFYGPYSDGITASRKFTAKNVRFANQTLERVKLIYADTHDNESFQGVIGSKLFDKTVMVLDFKQNLMWVKKAKGSCFEE